MKQVELIAIFFRSISSQPHIGLSHVSLFFAIYHLWQVNNFSEAIPITRKKLMALSKIKSIATYHKCIRELVEIDCIKYEPSYNPVGSLIYWAEQ